ncbi:MAG: 50S ribosomal protein L4 [Zetaproteobacteria bacterium]|nr:50S ribosomal protein L4 [Zetaproteobacteria bacterium]
MTEINIVDQANNVVGKRALNPEVFGLEGNPGFVHRVYSALSAAQRFGNHSTKTRAEVSGGGKKPWKQKGTGRARQGSTRSTQWRHGGIAHGPKTHGYETRLNKKERRHALKLVLSDALRSGKLILVNSLTFDVPKTKAFVTVANALNVSSGLYVLGSENNAVALSGRNIPNTKIVMDGQLNIQDLLKFKQIVLTTEALDKIEGNLGGEK